MESKKGSRFLNKYLIGDPKRGIPRPNNRRSQIFYLLRHYFPLIIFGSVFAIFFIAPLFIVLMVGSGMMANAISLSPEYEASIILTYNFWVYLIAIPFFILFGCGITGFSNVVKRLALEQGASLFDFYLGIKENFKHILIVYLIFGVSTWSLMNGVSVMNVNATNLPSFLYGFVVSLLIVQFVLAFLFAFTSQMMMLFYETKILGFLKNNFSIMIRKLFIIIPFSLIGFGIWIVPAFIGGIAQIVVLVILAFIGPTVSCFCYGLFGAFFTDKYINDELYPESYHRGLSDFIDLSHDK